MFASTGPRTLVPSTHGSGATPRQRRHRAAGVIALTIACMTTSAALLADRLSDKDVKALIERINEERDRFEDQLDGELKRKIIRGPGGEVNVERYLDDLQENVKRLKERFTPEYAGSAEVTALLRQGTDIQRFMATQAPNLDGASEWNRLASSLRDLATAYGTSLPVPEGQQARRINDREVQKAAEAVAERADRFKKDLDTALKADKSVTPAARTAAVTEADKLKEEAKRLASLVGDGKPSSGEAKALLDRAGRIRIASTGRPMSPSIKSSWGEIERALDVVARAFELPAR
jgi:hypothetical protein